MAFSYYVLTGRWFDEPIDIKAAVEEHFDVLTLNGSDVSFSEGDLVFENPEWGGLIIFHKSWGKDMSHCLKLKAYVVNYRSFATQGDESEWKVRMAHKINDWLLEHTAAEPVSGER